jgi:hypothetical protein
MVLTQQGKWLKSAAATEWWRGAVRLSVEMSGGSAMAVTHKSLRSAQAPRRMALSQRLYTAIYAITLILAAIAIYVVVSLLVGKGQVLLDDLRYGRPRTTQLDAFVDHEEAAGQPTHLMAINLNRQAMVIELPGGDAAKTRVISGPYLFGAEEDLTPLRLSLRDMDADGKPDLLLDVRNEQIVYLNREGAFRLPTPAEQATLNRGSGQ